MKKYFIIVIMCFVLCAAMVWTSYKEYTDGKILITTELEHDKTYTSEFVSDRSGTAERDETININTASAQELVDFLPGIGKTKAENIVAYRKAIGGFKSVEELIEVKGIGQSTLESIRDYCRVSDD